MGINLLYFYCSTERLVFILKYLLHSMFIIFRQICLLKLKGQKEGKGFVCILHTAYRLGWLLACLAAHCTRS